MISLNEQFDAPLAGYLDNSGYSTNHVDIRTPTVYTDNNLPFKKVPVHQLNKLVVGESESQPHMHQKMIDLKFAYRKQYEQWDGANVLNVYRTGTEPEILITIGQGETDIDSWIEKNPLATSDFSEDSIDISGFSESAKLFIVMTVPISLIGLFTDSDPYAGPAWETGTLYEAGAFATYNGLNYLCIVSHTSGVFATDLTNGKWSELPPFAQSWISFTDQEHDAEDIDWNTSKIMLANEDATYNIVGRIGEDIRVEASFPVDLLDGLEIIKTVRLHVYNPLDFGAFTISRIGIREPNESSNMDVDTRLGHLSRSSGVNAQFLNQLPIWTNSDPYKIWSNGEDEGVNVISGSVVANFNTGELPGGYPAALTMSSGRTRVDFDSDPVNLTGYGFTIECWIKLSDDSITWPMGLVSKYTESGYDEETEEYGDVHGAYRLGIADKEIVFQIGESTFTSDGANLVQDVWHHIAVTQDTYQLYLYANGNQVGQFSAVEIPEDDSPFALGTWS